MDEISWQKSDTSSVTVSVAVSPLSLLGVPVFVFVFVVPGCGKKRPGVLPLLARVRGVLVATVRSVLRLRAVAALRTPEAGLGVDGGGMLW